jgi:transposase
MVHMPTSDELAALRQALADALKHNESLAGELRVTRTERDLLKEQLNKFKRKRSIDRALVSSDVC